jgi:hypothetical protein
VQQLFLIKPRQLKTPGINTPSFDTVTITHQFHPHFKMQFQVVSIQKCWGEGRVRYCDERGTIRSIPTSWTDHKPYDMFLEQSAGRSIIHIKDIAELMQLIRSLQVKIRKEGGIRTPNDV